MLSLLCMYDSHSFRKYGPVGYRVVLWDTGLHVNFNRL